MDRPTRQLWVTTDPLSRVDSSLSTPSGCCCNGEEVPALAKVPGERRFLVAVPATARSHHLVTTHFNCKAVLKVSVKQLGEKTPGQRAVLSYL